jgi:hypothetical protein
MNLEIKANRASLEDIAQKAVQAVGTRGPTLPLPGGAASPPQNENPKPFSAEGSGTVLHFDAQGNPVEGPP